MKNNGKNYELIHDKTGNLDCPDCAFRNIDCSATEAVNKCNMYQVWKECAQEKETEQQSNCNLPQVINSDQLHICKYCGAETTQPDEQCYKAEDKASVCEDSLYEKTMKKGINYDLEI